MCLDDGGDLLESERRTGRRDDQQWIAYTKELMVGRKDSFLYFWLWA